MIQIDGLSFIEHLDFKAFNECKRLKKSVLKHKAMFGQCNQVSADRIYATNENRRFCTKQHIFTNFDLKGRALQDDQQRKQQRRLKDALNKDRATRLEGSFGNHKNHYELGKIKASNEANEQVWIYFGAFTANAVQLANQQRQKQTVHPKRQTA